MEGFVYGFQRVPEHCHRWRFFGKNLFRSVMDEISNLPLPEAFLNFLEENGIDPSIYTASDSTPRYVRLKPGCEAELEEIEAEMKCKLRKVDWLPGFYSLPPDIQIANSKAYQDGKIYGIDAASGAAVSALKISPGDHVLDLCAAPGAKICMMLDLLGDSGSVTGVDVARHRLAACRTILQKYSLGDRCRLFVADGTTFSLAPVRVDSVSRSCESAFEDKDDKFREWTSRRPWKERKRAAKAREAKSSQLVAVLVDAECTHDGSVRHIQKFEHWGWRTLQRRVLDAERTDSLTVLQLKLLRNGFRLLKVGGLLVYSTCSLTVAQNEDIVERFLKENASAELQEIDEAEGWPCKCGRIPKTLRFDPLTSQTSGLFVAKVTKLAT
ncbi:S-adenosyl-L-methionine-dependent methyltransferases superfamily protein isoform 4 [Theobroma cacao]|uniref:S-adenosyl-L-methionine-dependent methyltransferases superfamily protein isoform 4 n=1 Tax=Theobroma cacao TaxID=3641 RepID=A0A061DLI0_THECC|nr:S-adenosyl-L-methionine-dependent methyltransferases superfamily protein isoform 4 [Theobroma cacao]